MTCSKYLQKTSTYYAKHSILFNRTSFSNLKSHLNPFKKFIHNDSHTNIINPDGSVTRMNLDSLSKSQKKGLVGALPLPLSPIPHHKIVEYADEVFLKPAKFLGSIGQLSKNSFKTWPNKLLPEVAFLGVSNAGKSTLINALLNTKKLVKTSKKPGHTKSLNLFQAANKFVLVDMPGYGHRSRVEWGEIVEKYLAEGVSENGQLKRVYLLIESKRNFKHHDQMIIELLERLKVPYQILITKADKLNPKYWEESYLSPQTAPLASFIRQYAYSIADPSLLFLSPIRARFGLAQLRCQILSATELIPNRLKDFLPEESPVEKLPSLADLRSPSKAARRAYAASIESEWTQD